MPVINTNTITTLDRYGQKPDVQRAPNYDAAASAIASSARVYDAQIAIERDNLREKLGRIEHKRQKRINRFKAIEGVVDSAGKVVKFYEKIHDAEERREDLAARDAANKLMKYMEENAYSRVDESGNKITGSLDADYTFKSNAREGGSEGSSPSKATRKLYADWMNQDDYNQLSSRAREIFDTRYRDRIIDPYFRKADANTLAKYEAYKKNVDDANIALARSSLENACTFNSAQEGTYDNKRETFIAFTLDNMYADRGLAQRDGSGKLTFRKDEETGIDFRDVYNEEVIKLRKQWNSYLLGRIFQEAVAENDEDRFDEMKRLAEKMIFGGNKTASGEATGGQEADKEESATGFTGRVLPQEEVDDFIKAFDGLPKARRARIQSQWAEVKETADSVYYDYALGRIRGDANAENIRTTALNKAVSLYKNSPLPGDAERDLGIKEIAKKFYAPEIGEAIELSNRVMLDNAGERRLQELLKYPEVGNAVTKQIQENMKNLIHNEDRKLQKMDGAGLGAYLISNANGLTLGQKFPAIISSLNSAYQRGAISREKYNDTLSFMKDWDFILRHEKKDGLSDNEARSDNAIVDSAIDTLFGTDLNPSLFLVFDDNNLPACDNKGDFLVAEDSKEVRTHLLENKTYGEKSLAYGTKNKGVKLTAEAYMHVYTAARKYLTCRKIYPGDERFDKPLETFLKDSCAHELNTISTENLKTLFRNRSLQFDNFGYLPQ